MGADRINIGSRARMVIGGIFVLVVWGMYVVRIIWGVGVMRDEQRNPAPAIHYLAGAIIVSAIVVAWVGGRMLYERKQRKG